jgi:signal transduction histidine kinase
MRISVKLIVMVAVVAVVSSATVGVVGYFMGSVSLEERTKAQLESVAVLKDNQFQNFMNSMINRVAGIATEADFSREYETMLAEMDSKRPVSSVHEQFRTSLNDHLKLVDGIFELFAIDKMGIIHGSTEPLNEGKIQADELFFKEGLKGPFADNFYYSLSIQQPVTTVAAPIKDEAGNVIGVLAGRVNLDKISEIMLQDSGLGETGESFIVNQYHLLVTRSRRAPGLEFNKFIYTPQVNDCLSGNSGYMVGNDYLDYPVLVVYKWLPAEKLCLVTKIDQAEATKAANNILPYMGLLVLLSAVFSSFFGYLISRTISKPIHILRDSAIIIGGGKLGDESDRSGDELKEVTGAFKMMVQKLTEVKTNLEENIRERTAELNKKLAELEASEREAEKSKLAMINLLEDSQRLGEELKKEKEGIEDKVKERTKELSEEKAKLAASINSLSIGFLIADLNDNIILKNDAIVKVLGLNKDDVTITAVSGKFGNAMNIHVIHEQVTATKKAFEIKEAALGSKALRVLFTPVIITREEGEEVIGYVLLVEDITEKKILDRTRDEFFAVASHELRTPLTAIRGNSSMIRDFYASKINNKEVMDMVDDIHTASIRLIAIVNDFLDVSRLEQGKIEFKKEEVGLGGIIDEVVRELEQVAAGKKLYLKSEKASELPVIIADKDRLKQVVFNLIGNAIKFTESGGVTVRAEKTGNFIRVSVEDTGPGISLQGQALLFHKFQQASDKMLTRQPAQSSGLGLYISKMLVGAMGGEVGLEKSEVGKGSTFFFTIPVANNNQIK